AGCWRVDHGEGPADCLFGGVARYALCAHVPGDQPASGVEHENGIVGSPIDQEVESLLTFSQRLLCVLAFDCISNGANQVSRVGRAFDKEILGAILKALRSNTLLFRRGKYDDWHGRRVSVQLYDCIGAAAVR